MARKEIIRQLNMNTLSVEDQRLANLVDGIEDQDAVTLKQARDLIAAGGTAGLVKETVVSEDLLEETIVLNDGIEAAIGATDKATNTTSKMRAMVIDGTPQLELVTIVDGAKATIGDYVATTATSPITKGQVDTEREAYVGGAISTALTDVYSKDEVNTLLEPIDISLATLSARLDVSEARLATLESRIDDYSVFRVTTGNVTTTPLIPSGTISRQFMVPEVTLTSPFAAVSTVEGTAEILFTFGLEKVAGTNNTNFTVSLIEDGVVIQDIKTIQVVFAGSVTKIAGSASYIFSGKPNSVYNIRVATTSGTVKLYDGVIVTKVTGTGALKNTKGFK